MYLRYKDKIVSNNNIVWQVELWQEAAKPFAVAGLEFPYESPLTIEWPTTDKEEPLLGSSATLTVLSPGDRTYEDLYVIKAGSVRMDVYRGGNLYWSGCLDPEFYEEPYETASDYPVSLTFTDFGILDRLKYNLTGMRSLREILANAIARSGITTAAGISGPRTTTLPGSAADILDAVAVRSENFADEEGEWMSMREVLEGILQPLGLRMIQRAGRIYVYDLNGLYHMPANTLKAIEWKGDSAKMSTDKVANNVKITFSPYAEAALSTAALTYTEEYRRKAVNPWPSVYPGHGGLFSFYESLKPQVVVQPSIWGNASGDTLRALHFSIHTSDKGDGLETNNAMHFHIEPLFNGPSACDGIAVMFATGCVPRDGAKRGDYLVAPFPGTMTGTVYPGMVGENLYPESHYTDADAVLARMPRMSIPSLNGSDRAMTLLRIKLDMLLDCRYNPLSSDKDNNDDYDIWQWRARFAFVPISLVLKGMSGKTYIYTNCQLAQHPSGYPKDTLGFVLGSWREIAPAANRRKYAYLAYYNADSYDSDSGALHGWVTNRQCVGRCREKLGGQLKDIDAGQYVPYPPEGGELELTIYKGINGYSFDEAIEAPAAGALGMAEPVDWHRGKKSSIVLWPDGFGGNPDITVVEKGAGVYGAARWMLFKDLSVEIVDNNAELSEPGSDDVEYSGYLNADAKDPIEIDTICGTSYLPMPSARGVYHDVATGEAVSSMTRAGITNHPELLLIGTLYSQYATRHTVLSGVVSIDTTSGSLGCFTEVNQANKILMLTGETQDLADDASEATFTELSPDEYSPAEILNHG